MEGGEVLNSGVEWRSQPVTVGVQGSRYAAPFCKARTVFDAPHGFEAIVHIIILRAIEDETSDNRWCRAILIACGIAERSSPKFVCASPILLPNHTVSTMLPVPPEAQHE